LLGEKPVTILLQLDKASEKFKAMTLPTADVNYFPPF